MYISTFSAKMRADLNEALNIQLKEYSITVILTVRISP